VLVFAVAMLLVLLVFAETLLVALFGVLLFSDWQANNSVKANKKMCFFIFL
jgi:hypothetical protein